MIADCRRRVRRARRHWLGWLGAAASPLQMDARDDVPSALRPHYQHLLREGEVVWGHMVMANSHLYSPGEDDRPGNVIYSPAHNFDDHPERPC
jgi:hypothetical protein